VKFRVLPKNLSKEQILKKLKMNSIVIEQ